MTRGRVKDPPKLRYLHPPRFRFVDLFAGVGGFHLALSELGGDCVMACDIDPDCRSVYAEYFGMEPRADIAALAADPSIVPPHDVLCAGFPCQPFSKSGAQLGIRDSTRGTLFFDILRIIEHRRPGLVILENVRNLAGPRHVATLRTIVKSLRSLRYIVPDEPIVFSPHLLPQDLGGTPQHRERVFIVAVAEEASSTFSLPSVQNAPVGDWRPKEWRIDRWLEVDRPDDRQRYGLRPQERRWLNAWNEFVRMIDEDPLPGFPIWVSAFRSRLRIDPGCPDWKRDFLRKNHDFYMRNKRDIDSWIQKHDVRSFPKSRQKLEWQARGEPRNLHKLLIQMRPSGIRVRPPTYVPALVAINQTSIVGSRRRRMTPREVARLQGFPDDFPVHARDSVAYRQFGNAVNVGVVRFIASKALEPDRSVRQLELVSA